MSAVRQLGGNATTLGVKSDAPTREGEIIGKMYIASNLAVGSNVFSTNALDIYGSASISSALITKDQLLASTTLNTPVAPAIAFSGDTMTGFYRPAHQNVAVSTGGMERLRFTSNGPIGIGITTPITDVHIVGDVRIQNSNNGYGLVISQSNAEVAGEATGIGFHRAANATNIGGKLLFISDATGAGRGDFSMQLKTGAGTGDASTEVLRIRNTGRVGVNTANPVYTLDVVDGSGLRVFSAAEGAAVNIQDQMDIGYAASNGVFLSNAGVATGDIVMRYRGSGAGKMVLAASNTVTGATGVGVGLMVSGSNQIGIATSVVSPQAALTIAGHANGLPKLAFANDTITNRHIVLWQNPALNNEYQFMGLGVRAGEFRSTIDATGSAFTWIAGTGSASETELMRVTGGGSVGIGTNAPGAGVKLHVAGTARMEASVETQKYILTNDGTGAAPSIAWSNETGLGLYRASTGTIAVRSGSSGETVQFTPSNVVIAPSASAVVSGNFKLGVRGSLVTGDPDGSSVAYMVLDGDTRRKFALVNSNSPAAAALSFQIQDGSTTTDYNTWRPLMNLTSNGALVIGAATATSNVDKLFVSGVARVGGDLHAEGTVIAPTNRTAAIPSYSFQNSLTSGLYAPAVDTVALSTATTERVRFHAGGAISIKNTTSTLRDFNVGGTTLIGTTFPATNWHDSLLHLATNTGLTGIGLQSTTGANEACAIANSNQSLLLTTQSGGILFMTGSGLSSGVGGTERMRITSNGVGIGTNTGITRDLEVQNTARVGNRLYHKFIRTLGFMTDGTSTSVTMICNLTATGGAYFVHVVLVQSDSNNSITKGYYVPISYNCTNNAWMRVTPVNSSGPFNGNEFDLDIRTSNETTLIRLYRTSAATDTVSTSNITCTVIVDQSEINQVTVTDFNISAGVTIENLPIYPYTPVSISGSRQAIGSTTYRAKVNIGADTVDNAVGLEVNQNTAAQWILDLRSQNTTVLNVQSTGAVGIGKTNAATEKLWVEGTTYLNGGLTVTGQQVQNWGTVAAPGYSFSNSLGAGLVMPTQNAVALTTQGVVRFLASNGRVGIHTSNPSRGLHLVGDAELEGVGLFLGQSNTWPTVAVNTTYTASNYEIRMPPDRVTTSNLSFTGGMVHAKDLLLKGAAVEGDLRNNTAPYTNPSTVAAGSLFLEGGSYINTSNNGDGSVQQFGGDIVLRGGLTAVGTGGFLANSIPATTQGSIIFQTGFTSNVNRDGSNFFERARLDGRTGFMGIGLSNPSQPLHVQGNAIISSNLLANDFLLTRAIPNHAVAAAKLLVTEHSNIRASVGLSENASGFVGLGTAPNASFILDVSGETRMQSRANFTTSIHGGTTGAHQQAFINMLDSTANRAKVHLGDQTNTRRHMVLHQGSASANSEVQFMGMGVQTGTLLYQIDSAVASSAHRFFAASNTTINTELMAILGNGNVGIGVTTTTYKLEVAGVVKADNFVSLSDRRIKTNLQPLHGDDMLHAIGKLQGYKYTRTDAMETRRYGLIAQEVEAVLPYAVTKPDPLTDLKAVSYTDLVPVLLEAVKRLNERVVQLENLIVGV